MNYFQRHLAQDWTANGNNIRVGTNGRHIAYTGPHHTPPHEYPAGLAKEDEAHAIFIAKSPAIYRAALSVIEAHRTCNSRTWHDSIDALETALKDAVK